MEIAEWLSARGCAACRPFRNPHLNFCLPSSHGAAHNAGMRPHAFFCIFFVLTLALSVTRASDEKTPKEVAALADRFRESREKNTEPLRAAALQQLKALQDKYTKQARLEDALAARRIMADLQWAGLWEFHTKKRDGLLALIPGGKISFLGKDRAEGTWDADAGELNIRWENGTRWVVKPSLNGTAHDVPVTMRRL